jgi:hypothetical protein
VKKWLLPKEQAFHFELELKVQPVEDGCPGEAGTASKRHRKRCLGLRQGSSYSDAPKRAEQVST